MNENEIIDFVLKSTKQEVFYVAMTLMFEHGYRYVGISKTPMMVQIDSDIPKMNKKELNIWLDKLELWERKNKQTYKFLYGRGVDKSLSTL